MFFIPNPAPGGGVGQPCLYNSWTWQHDLCQPGLVCVNGVCRKPSAGAGSGAIRGAFQGGFTAQGTPQRRRARRRARRIAQMMARTGGSQRFDPSFWLRGAPRRPAVEYVPFAGGFFGAPRPSPWT